MRLAAEHLRRQVLRLVNAGESACFSIEAGSIKVRDGILEHSVDLRRMPPVTDHGDVLLGEGTFDPPTTPLDANGHGIPYATYSFSAQIALVEVDVDLGATKVLRMRLPPM